MDRETGKMQTEKKKKSKDTAETVLLYVDTPPGRGGESRSAVVINNPTEVFRDLSVPWPHTRLGNNTPPTYDSLGIFS